MKKIISVLLSLALCLGMWPPIVLAAEDNADSVRAQLDHILDLCRELDGDEQEKLDLARCYALQGALDGANAPMPVSTGEVVVSQGTSVIFTAGDCGNNCPGHRITQSGTSAVGATKVYVSSGEHNVTFSGLNLTGANVGVMPGGTMHLTIEGSNSINTSNLSGIYVPKTAVLTIDGAGSLTVRSTASTGIGGSISAPNGSAGDLDCGTVVINSGTVTVFGGSSSAGIGGACKQSTEPGGSGGDVTINGGEVAVTGGDNQWGGPAIGSPLGNPVGCIGTLTINGGHLTLAATSQYGKSSGFGSSSNRNPSTGSNKMILASAGYLTLTDGTILDSRASYELMGTPLTMDLITVPEGLVYTGADLTDTAKSKISLGSEGAVTQSLFGVDFTVITDIAGWTYTITPAPVKEAGEYTVTYTKGSDKVTKTFTVAGVTASLGEIETYNGDTKALGFGVGDTITVKVPAPTLEPPLADTSGLKMAVYCGSTRVSQPAAANADGSYTMEVSTNKLVELLNLDFSNGVPEKEVTLTAKYLGNSSVSSAEASVKVGIYADAMIEKDGNVSYVGGNWGDLFEDSGNDGAIITLLGNHHLHSNLDIRINCTLNLNNREITSTETEYAIYVAPNCQVTIQGPGIVDGGGLLVAGDVRLDGVTFPSTTLVEYSAYAVSVVSGGKLSVTGNTYIENRGYGLEVKGGAAVQLSSGTYSGDVAAIKIFDGDMTLADLLAGGCAYYRGDTPIPLSELEGQKELTGPVTVQACDHTGAESTNNGDGTHRVNCPYCGYTSADEPHSFNETGLCPACKLQAAAKVEKSGSDTVYVEASGLADVFAEDSGNDGATITLLADVERTADLIIKINCTLDLNGKTVHSKGEYAPALGISSGATVTIRDQSQDHRGQVISEQLNALAVLGTVTLEGGTFTSNGENSHGVYVNSDSASLFVTGEHVTIRNTGGGYGLAVNAVQSVQLSAGTYSGGRAAIKIFDYDANSPTLGDLLAASKEDGTRYAYFDGDTPITGKLGGRELTGTVTVRECGHTGVEVKDLGSGKHGLTCPYCGYHSEHTTTLTATVSGNTVTFRGGCASCDYQEEALAAAAFTFPKLTYGQTGQTVSCTWEHPGGYALMVQIDSGEELQLDSSATQVSLPLEQLFGNPKINAGNYKLNVYCRSYADMTSDVCSLPFTVDPAPLTADMVTLSAESATYSGTEQKPTVTVAGLTEGTDYETSYKRGDAATTDFTNAGTVNITVNGKGNYTGSVEKTYTIGKATPTIEWADDEVELTYTGQPAAIEPTVTLVNGEAFSGTITYTYGTYSGPDLPTNVGTYSIKASITEQDNYTAADSSEMTLTIKKANVTVTAPAAKTLTYTGEAQALVEAGTVNVGDIVYSTAQDGTYTKNIPTGTNAGTYDVWYKVEGTDNYNGTAPAKVAVTINKANHEDVTVETSAKFGTSRTYDISGLLPDGAELGNITASGGIFANPQPAVNKGVLSYTLVANQDNVNDSGTVTVPVTSSTNYTAFNLIIKITVADVDIPELTVDAISVTYTGQPVSDLKISGTAVVNGTPVKGGWSFAPGQALTDVADSGLKEVIFTPEDSTSYGKAKGYAQVQIGKATPTLRLTASPTAMTGGAVTFSLSGLPDGGTADLTCPDEGITVTRNQDGTFTAKIPQDSTDKTYTFTAAYAGDGNHEKANTSCSVLRKALTELPDPPAGDGANQFKLVMEEGISEVPAGLKAIESLNTPEELEAVMKTKVTEQTPTIPAANTAVYDVALLVSMDGGKNWTAATKDNFPAGGLTVTLPYPSGTDSSYTFTVVHMFTTTDFSKDIGDIETPAVTNTANGLRFTVTGLSPISVGWEKKTSQGGGSGGGGGWVSYYSIKVNDSEHGKVTADRTSMYSGGTVTLTVKPDEGYRLDKITVTDSQNKAVELTEKNGKYTFKMPSRNVTVKADFVPAGSPSPAPSGSPSPSPSGSPTPTTSPSPSPKPWKNPFPDVSDTGWYIKAVEFVCKNGLMAGYENGKFGPNNDLTRAQFAQIIYNKAGRPQAGSGVFRDVTTGWYANAVNWAAAEGIVTGVGGGKFAPDRPITRQDLAVMLWRYAGSPEPRKNELDFSDAGKTSEYAWKALCWANENDIVSGKGNRILDPKGKATRAEAAQMMMKYLKK